MFQFLPLELSLYVTRKSPVSSLHLSWLNKLKRPFSGFLLSSPSLSSWEVLQFLHPLSSLLVDSYVHILHPLLQWYLGRASLHLPTALLCPAMGPTKPGTLADLSWFGLILYPAPERSLIPGLDLPWCSLVALLLDGWWSVGPACQSLPWYSKETSSARGATILWGFLQLCLRSWVPTTEDIIKP